MKTNKVVKTIANIEADECRWPFGDPRQEGFHFCGEKKIAGRPYCSHHWEMSFMTTKPKQQASVAPLPIRRAA